MRFGDITDFHIHVIFATNTLIAAGRRDPRLPRRLVRDHRLHAKSKARRWRSPG